MKATIKARERAAKVYDSISRYHPDWNREFEGWFTAILLSDSRKDEYEAAMLAADHCGDWLGGRRPWSNDWAGADPLEKRERAKALRRKRPVNDNGRARLAFYETHEEVIKSLTK